MTRTTRRLDLTELGQSYLEGYEKLLEQVHNLEHNTRSQSTEPSANLVPY